MQSKYLFWQYLVRRCRYLRVVGQRVLCDTVYLVRVRNMRFEVWYVRDGVGTGRIWRRGIFFCYIVFRLGLLFRSGIFLRVEMEQRQLGSGFFGLGQFSVFRFDIWDALYLRRIYFVRCRVISRFFLLGWLGVLNQIVEVIFGFCVVDWGFRWQLEFVQGVMFVGRRWLYLLLYCCLLGRQCCRRKYLNLLLFSYG